MSEALAHRLKTLCRLYFAGGLFYLWYTRHQDHPLQPAVFVLLLILFIGMAWLTAYLSFLLGVDVLGLGRLFGVPPGKPFPGLYPGEEERLRFDYTRGRIGRASYNGIFKLLLTDQRLLAGANLTSWHLLEIPLREITTATVRTSRWFTSSLQLTQVGPRGTEQWTVGLSNSSEFAKLVEELKRLGVPVQAGP